MQRINNERQKQFFEKEIYYKKQYANDKRKILEQFQDLTNEANEVNVDRIIEKKGRTKSKSILGSRKMLNINRNQENHLLTEGNISPSLKSDMETDMS